MFSIALALALSNFGSVHLMRAFLCKDEYTSRTNHQPQSQPIHWARGVPMTKRSFEPGCYPTHKLETFLFG